MFLVSAEGGGSQQTFVVSGEGGGSAEVCSQRGRGGVVSRGTFFKKA